MSNIQIKNLSFRYEGVLEYVFNNVSLVVDTSWKLGLIGRNGKGKTTFLNLLLGKYSYKGIIATNVEFSYFPFEVKNKERITIEIINELIPYFEEWKLIKELNLLKTDINVLHRPFNTLSGGEGLKVLLASLFLKENSFLLIDEPTNHLDIESRKNVQKYLATKEGFILVSHDREFLDNTVDHMLSINNTDIKIQKGNYSTWQENKEREDNFEIKQNSKLSKDIERLEIAAKSTANWSDKIEKTKYGEGKKDTGYIGHMSAKMMKKSKVIEKRQMKEIEDKSKLLKNIDKADNLIMKPLEYNKNILIKAKDFSIKFDNKKIFKNTDFEIKQGDRVAIIGKNGSGKSSILKLILGKGIECEGFLSMGHNMKISYVSQNTEMLNGNLREFARNFNIDESVFKAMLVKLGINQNEFDKNIAMMSEGQKKKILIAKSITQSADLYIWDEPLNFIDILSRVQIEEVLLKHRPTLIFVEHDERFVDKVATNKIILDKF